MHRIYSLVPRRWLQAMAACVMAVVMLGADNPEGRFNRIGHNMICMCSCGQILLECNHVGCPVSPKMIAELQTQVGSGLPQEGVFNWFVAKYGAVVLAAPSRGGFDRVAWIMPFAVTLMATLGTAVLVRLWTRRRREQVVMAGPYVPGTLEHSSVRDRIRRETEY